MSVKVLVVDDSALMRKLFTETFIRNGFKVASARNGEEALSKAAEFRPEVITLDINMPVMDGITCLSLLKRVYQCPVLMLSSLTSKGALVTLEALALGAADYVLKPGGTVTRDICEIEKELVEKISALAGKPGSRISHQLAHPAAPASRAIQPARPVSTKSGDIQYVFIGVSTGGPKKLEQILTRLPADFPCPVIVAQHMPAQFTAALARRLDNLCHLHVVEVSSRMRIEPGHIYMAKGDADISLLKNAGQIFARPVPASPKHLWHPSVDRMVESAMGCINPANMLCIQLTGMGYDGVAAIAQAYRHGAVTIAESENTATVFGMPKELIQTGCASHILDSNQIASRVLNICKISGVV